MHPLRVARFRPATIAATVVWCFTSFWLIFTTGKPDHPSSSEPLVFAVWIAASIYFAAICFIRTLEEPEVARKDGA